MFSSVCYIASGWLGNIKAGLLQGKCVSGFQAERERAGGGSIFCTSCFSIAFGSKDVSCQCVMSGVYRI